MTTKKTDRHVKRRRRLLREYKDRFGGKCSICGYDKNYACLDFHHLRDKKFLINSLTIEKRKEVIESEVIKCELLCRNCHTDLHFPHLRKIKPQDVVYPQTNSTI